MTPRLSPQRMAFAGVGLLALVAIGAAFLALRDSGGGSGGDSGAAAVTRE